MMKCQTAKKAHRCYVCGRRIPIGVKYWTVGESPDIAREHTNCLNFITEPALPESFHLYRSKYDIEGNKK